MAQQNFRCAGCGMAVAQGKEPLANSSPVFESFFLYFFFMICVHIRKIFASNCVSWLWWFCSHAVYHTACLPHRDADKNSAKIERSMRAKVLQAMQGIFWGGDTRARLLQAMQGRGVTRERDSYRQSKRRGWEGRWTMKFRVFRPLALLLVVYSLKRCKI